MARLQEKLQESAFVFRCALGNNTEAPVAFWKKSLRVHWVEGGEVVEANALPSSVTLNFQAPSLSYIRQILCTE